MPLTITFEELLRYTNGERDKWRKWLTDHSAALEAPVQRVTGADVPMPYSKPLEQAAFPHEEHVMQAAIATFRDL